MDFVAAEFAAESGSTTFIPIFGYGSIMSPKSALSSMPNARYDVFLVAVAALTLLALQKPSSCNPNRLGAGV